MYSLLLPLIVLCSHHSSLSDLPSSRVEASTVADGPLPTELVARTEQEYMVLGVSPVAITCVSGIVSEKSGEEEEQVTV